MKQSIGIVAMDFDLTLLEWHDGKPYVSPEIQDLLVKLVESGIEVGIVSGRYSWAMRRLLGEVGVAWGQSRFPHLSCPVRALCTGWRVASLCRTRNGTSSVAMN